MKRSKLVEKEVAEAAAENVAKATPKLAPKAKRAVKKAAAPVAVEPVVEVTAETPAPVAVEPKAEKKAKAKKAAKKGPQVRHAEIFKKSVASVIRALAVAGVETAIIVKAIQKRVPNAKLSGIQSSIYEGKKGIFAPAELTEKQLASLTEGVTA